jgi:hemerythrin-like domain-containing protein
MRRDPRLHGLSSDHHHALALAREVRLALASGAADDRLAREVAARFDAELEPHFRVEEQVLLPALRAAGEAALVERTLEDHAFLRERAAYAAEGWADRLGSLADRLVRHVRFEEGELFPRCETALDDAVLDEVARLAPKGR